jgi:hypothetical protein
MELVDFQIEIREAVSSLKLYGCGNKTLIFKISRAKIKPRVLL